MILNEGSAECGALGAQFSPHYKIIFLFVREGSLNVLLSNFFSYFEQHKSYSVIGESFVYYFMRKDIYLMFLEFGIVLLSQIVEKFGLKFT